MTDYERIVNLADYRPSKPEGWNPLRAVLFGILLSIPLWALLWLTIVMVFSLGKS